MAQSVSALSLAAAGFYVVVAMAASAAAFTARVWRQPSWHWLSWLLVAFFFALLAASRLLDLEESARTILREMLRSDAAYETRRDFQRPLAAAAIVAAAAAGFWWVHRLATRLSRRRDLALMCAHAACLAMALLIALRLVSLHAIDRVLYGPIKLNWIADTGITCLVMAAAVYYLRIVRSRR